MLIYPVIYIHFCALAALLNTGSCRCRFAQAVEHHDPYIVIEIIDAAQSSNKIGTFQGVGGIEQL